MRSTSPAATFLQLAPSGEYVSEPLPVKATRALMLLIALLFGVERSRSNFPLTEIASMLPLGEMSSCTTRMERSRSSDSFDRSEGGASVLPLFDQAASSFALPLRK